MPQQVDSPPPKPPRRRYSDQISVSSLGTHSTSKKQEDSLLKNESKSKICNIKPTYLSLPSNLTSNPLIEFKTSTLATHYLKLSNQLKFYNKIESLPKDSKDKFLLLQPGGKQTLPNLNARYENKENFKCAYQGSNSDHTLSNDHCGNITSCSLDKLIRSFIYKNALFSRKCDSQSLKTSNIYCHRRYHSDSTISYFSLSNQSSVLKSDIQNCSDNIFFSSKMIKNCESRTMCCCCKKNYLILQEIQSLKEINEKLWQHLCSVQSCLETIKRKNYEKCTDISISGLLSSIYYAQKAKDSAMEERLKIAFEERDSAFLELENIIYVLSKSLDTTDAFQCEGNRLDKRTIDLLDEIGCSLNPSNLLKYQKKLLTHLCRLKASKQDELSHELKCAMVERCDAVDKARKLEEDVKNLKMYFDLWHLDNKCWELALFDIMHQLIHQRDNVSKVDTNLDMGSVIHRIPVGRIDSLERYSVSQYISRSGDHQLVSNDKHSKIFGESEKIKTLQEEIIHLNTELEDERSKREQAERKCLRLERLIHTSRIKLNGQNIGVPV